MLDQLNDFAPQNLSNIVWAFEKANVSHQDLYKRVGDHLISLDHLNNFQPQNLSNILIAYAKAGVSHPDLFNKVGDHIVTRQHLNDFKPQNLANIVWSYAKAEVSHPDLFNKLANHIVSLDHLNDFKPQDLSNIIYAYAKAQEPHPNLFNKVADHIVSLDNLDGYNEQEISNLVWSYHKAGVIRQDLNDKLISVADRKFSRKRLETLKHWASKEESIENQEVDVQAYDESGSVVSVEDENNENSIEDDKELEEDTASTPEDLSLLTVVQLKDRLRNLGLRVSGRKHELISRLNDHFTVQGVDK